MSHYNLVYDKEEMEKFLIKVLNTVTECKTYNSNIHCFLSYIASRRKYGQKCTQKSVFNRKTFLEPNIDRIIHEVCAYSVPKDCYRVYNQDKPKNPNKTFSYSSTPLHDDSMVIYWTLNPCNSMIAWFNLYTKVKTQIENKLKNDNNNVEFNRIQSFMKNELHKTSKMFKLWFEIDIDTKDENIVRKIVNILKEKKSNNRAYSFTVETHGGYHVVYRRDKYDSTELGELMKELKTFTFQEYSRDGKKTLLTKYYADVRMDATVPLPGTLQGGFKVKMTELF